MFVSFFAFLSMIVVQNNTQILLSASVWLCVCLLICLIVCIFVFVYLLVCLFVYFCKWAGQYPTRVVIGISLLLTEKHSFQMHTYKSACWLNNIQWISTKTKMSLSKHAKYTLYHVSPTENILNLAAKGSHPSKNTGILWNTFIKRWPPPAPPGVKKTSGTRNIPGSAFLAG